MLLCAMSVGGVAEDRSLYDVSLTWHSEHGDSFALNSLKGTPVVLTMAYASCRSACPVMMKRLKKLHQILDEEKLEASLVIVSLSPEMDTPEAMKLFKKENGLKGNRWHFIRGSKDTTRIFSNLIEYNYQQNPNTEEIMHSNKVVLLDKKGVITLSVEGLSSDLAPLVTSITKLNKGE